MKLVAVVAALLLACVVSADEECTSLERIKVKHQWYEAYGHGHERIVLGLKIYNKLFHDHPEARSLFSRVHGDNTYSPEFEAHAQRVLGGIDNCISLLDDPATLAAELEHLKGQHGERGIDAAYYDKFVEEFLEVMGDYLGPKLDYGAWSHCMHFITERIKG